jgi:DNA-binding NarL/FixJ family response regulator
MREFRRAERAWSKLPCPYEAAQALEQRGRYLLDEGERTGGDCLLAALKEFEDLGATWDAARVRAALRSHKVGLPYPFRGGHRGYGGKLSPREGEVARLATMGRTNPEIAHALFISPRTVENHVAAAMRKLGVRSRKELLS